MKNKSLDLRQYQESVKETAKKDFEKKEDELANWGLGVVGEAGDLAGCIKKTIYHDNNQTAGIRENIGDTIWYLAMICNFFGWDFEEILFENIKKLKKRYTKGFNSKEASRGGTRVDWNEK
jgi:NTP pyrophosphatase (non-canonical NTP hydrolase)